MKFTDHEEETMLILIQQEIKYRENDITTTKKVIEELENMKNKLMTEIVERKAKNDRKEKRTQEQETVTNRT